MFEPEGRPPAADCSIPTSEPSGTRQWTPTSHVCCRWDPRDRLERGTCLPITVEPLENRLNVAGLFNFVNVHVFFRLTRTARSCVWLQYSDRRQPPYSGLHARLRLDMANHDVVINAAVLGLTHALHVFLSQRTQLYEALPDQS